MTWMRERDALIAQTRAFIQSVTGVQSVGSGRDAGEPLPLAAPEPAPPLRAAETPPSIVSAIAEVSAITELPKAAGQTPRPLVPGDLQRELTSRIASFRAHQERFNREREAYFSATLARLRASIKDGLPRGPHTSA